LRAGRGGGVGVESHEEEVEWALNIQRESGCVRQVTKRKRRRNTTNDIGRRKTEWSKVLT